MEFLRPAKNILVEIETNKSSKASNSSARYDDSPINGIILEMVDKGTNL